MSSSICWNPDAIVDCGGCPDECRWRPEDDDISRDSCCSNFDRVQSFADRLVRALDDGLGTQRFSLVQYASEASVSNELSSSESMLDTILRLEYLGGGRATHRALLSCEEDFFRASSVGKKSIILITDDFPTEPRNANDPEDNSVATSSAKSAATSVKFLGTNVFPVFISDGNDQEANDFMRDISSDGRLRTAEFDALNKLVNGLVSSIIVPW